METPLMQLIIFITVIIISSWPSPSTAGVDPLQWEIVSRSNFSSQIRLHTNILLIVTLPWFGESRSLMKELAKCIANENNEYESPKLMVLYRNRERMLADAIGANDRINIIFYHHSLSYKYQGRLRSQNILSSFNYLISNPSELLPIQPLNTRADLEMFLQSSDKALLLLEFCGWTHKLLASGRKNGTTNDFGTGILGESDGSLPAQLKKYQPSESEKMTCDAQDGFSGISWLEEFSSVSESDSNKSFVGGASCSSGKFQQFDTFFTKFMIIAREFSLPPERLRFGFIGDKSMMSSLEYEGANSWLSSLKVFDSDSWSMSLHFSGCPTCSIILKKEDDLRSALQIQNPLATELGDGGHDTDPTLPANSPSIILFIDRSSDSLSARIKSKETLDAFRSLAVQFHKNNIIGSHFGMKTESMQKKKLSSSSKKVELKDKVSMAFINKGKHITLDKTASGSQANSLQEILQYVLQGGNGVKLSSLAKEVGFQLLSDDFDVNVQKKLPTQTEVLESDQSEKVSFPTQNDEKDEFGYSGPFDPETIFDKIKWSSVKPVQLHDNKAVINAKDEVDIDEKLHSEIFKGNFFFLDGEYKLLQALTGDLKIPSVIVIDPIKQNHYVLKKETDFSLSSLADFVNEYLNGSLIPFQKSEIEVKAPTEAASLPFVNLDFRATDSISQLTSDTFSELVIGFNKTDNIAWKKDVLVLFSNSWCGFCQRMELVVSEVYKIFKHYATTQQVDAFRDVKAKFPQFYFMECTLNECRFILRAAAQREVYPYLLLFPAENKTAVPYEGDIVVSDIIKFVVHYGNKARDLVNEKGTLLSGIEREKKTEVLQEDALKMSELEEASSRRDKHHEILFEHQIPEKVIKRDRIETQIPILEDASQVTVGSLLIATEQLLNHIYPFDNALILIIKADENTGFQGLIINKHISWDYVGELEDNLELLKNARLSFGGPVLLPGRMPLLSLTRKITGNRSHQILQNIYLLGQNATIHEIEGIKSGINSVSDFWFFLGFSSWGRDQLFDEINRGDWNVTVGEYEYLDCPWD